jgi:hypothetical protein
MPASMPFDKLGSFACGKTSGDWKQRHPSAGFLPAHGTTITCKKPDKAGGG